MSLPETKENHIQKPNILKLFFPKIEDLKYGSMIELKTNQMNIINH
jgi:hypothetical protein